MAHLCEVTFTVVVLVKCWVALGGVMFSDLNRPLPDQWRSDYFMTQPSNLIPYLGHVHCNGFCVRVECQGALGSVMFSDLNQPLPDQWRSDYAMTQLRNSIPYLGHVYCNFFCIQTGCQGALGGVMFSYFNRPSPDQWRADYAMTQLCNAMPYIWHPFTVLVFVRCWAMPYLAPIHCFDFCQMSGCSGWYRLSPNQ